MDLYFESAGMILTLITVGKYLESRAKGKNLSSDYQLINLAPKTDRPSDRRRGTGNPAGNGTGRGYSGGKAGQSIPTDGRVAEGLSAWMNQRLPGRVFLWRSSPATRSPAVLSTSPVI